MIRIRQFLATSALFLAFVGLPQTSSKADEPALQLKPGDNICYIGNTLADRMQHHAWLETYLSAMHPKHELTFRNLGFAGDEVKTRPRSDNFGSPDQWLTKAEADVVFCFFGYNEALRGEPGLPGFKNDLAQMIDGMLGQKYNGKSAPRLVVFSPIAHENLNSPHLPDGTQNNKSLAVYTRTMQDVCKARGVPFVDLFTPTRELYRAADEPLTMNGVHLLDHGNRALADVIVQKLFAGGDEPTRDEAELERLRNVILEKNLYWFSRYRVVDGYNVYGGRSKLAWFGQSNADVMRREMEIFDVMTANRDKRVWAVAQGRDLKVVDDNIPEQVVVKTNKPGQLEDGKHPYLGGKEAMGKMKLAEGMQVNLFASEEMFPEMVNPVQMAVDTDGRLFASVWPSYPHWNPTEPRTDRIVCLPDENGDGVADECIVFADKLNSVTGFEFWGGGLLVAAPPEIWFLKDSDGDDKADVKIRMLQGVSSADTHHSANAMVIGPDGGLYWSRGIFNIANMETPTTTYRSGSSGVHRFDPRTFEVGFHFPIGPNPHGDLFDQWGFQFANDGTSGTGSYVNIGHGKGHKQWFKKRVRPVAATGILSSSHFPEHNNGNFLICNTIGFLGVLQHKVEYNGADITAEEIEPMLVSSDPNFRPTDIEIGGDGALYVSDWCNVLIGHMQHNMRDPNRDHAHGRIYRVTHADRPLLKPRKLKGQPIETVLEAFFAKENSVRYRARLELSGRDTQDVTARVSSWAGRLNPNKPDEAQALLECLWVFEEHRVPNHELLKRVFVAEEPRVRAAAIRTLGHWGQKIGDWEPTLVAAARDESALVRAEAVKAAVSFKGLSAAEIVFEVATRPTDPELDVVLDYARGKMNVSQIVRDALNSRTKLSPAARAYVLRHASVDDLLKLDRSAEVYETILARESVSPEHLGASLVGLAKLKKANALELLLDLIEIADVKKQPSLAGLGRMLSRRSAEELQKVRDRIEDLATAGKSAPTRRFGYAAWMTADGSGDDAFLAASQDENRLRDFLAAVALVAPDDLRSQLYGKVRGLIFELPTGLKSGTSERSTRKRGIHVDYFYPSASDVALETLATMKPSASGTVPEIIIDVPQRKHADKFALRFTGTIHVAKPGKYTFFTKSDDGSRLYIGKKLVVNNDGLHGMQERKGAINLPAGPHPLVVTYFDNGGGDGLGVSWKGPGFKKQKIAADRLNLGGGETLHDVAIRSLAVIPGHEQDKVVALASLVKAGRHRESAIAALRGIDAKHWPEKEVPPMVDNLVGFLSSIPVALRTAAPATDAIALAKTLSTRLPDSQAKAILDRLQNLDVRVIAIGTVPHRMIYDKEQIVVQAGKPVEFRFSNSDNMPHNFAIVEPGSLEEIGLLAEATARDADAMARHYIPKSDRILLASRLLQPSENQALSYEAPATPGIYPYVCTYPGHWRRMYGALYIVDNLDEYQSNPVAYLAEHKLPIQDELLTFNTRGREWKFDEFAAEVKSLPEGRSFDVGKQVFKVSNCIACHRLDNEGQVFGPDLAKLDDKKHTVTNILQSLLEPSKVIDQKYQSYSLILESGKVITGMIVEETAEAVDVVIDPLAKAKPTRIEKSEIEERIALKTSIMPQGLLDRLSREEILDLVAYVYARGDKKHELFETHHHH